ncbi:YceI family protein [Saccharicrinis sp. FJH54]|uniref:YceI family protein n=1 Tax=Saccharicrinis sp. FJH54 TaxID=3344665 RepID=UPI0035D40F68
MKTINLLTVLVLSLLVSNVSAEVLKANTNKSEITWTGKKVGGQHHGTIDLKSGQLEVKNNAITGGEFVVDMNSIKNLDLESQEYNQKLVGHLKSDDFFSVEKHPEAKLMIRKNFPVIDGSTTVTGDLTIKGITHPITFDVNKEGNTYTANINVDRAKYDVRYGSDSFFDNLGDKVIDDIFVLGVKLVVE